MLMEGQQDPLRHLTDVKFDVSFSMSPYLASNQQVTFSPLPDSTEETPCCYHVRIRRAFNDFEYRSCLLKGRNEWPLNGIMKDDETELLPGRLESYSSLIKIPEPFPATPPEISL